MFIYMNLYIIYVLVLHYPISHNNGFICFSSILLLIFSDLNISHVLTFEMMNMMPESTDDDVIHLALIFAAVFSTVMSDEKHISRAH